MRTSMPKVRPEERLQQVQPEPQPTSAPPAIAQAELERMIAEAAYYRAEKRGFAPGFEAGDWTEAEAEIKARVRAVKSAM